MAPITLEPTDLRFYGVLKGRYTLGVKMPAKGGPIIYSSVAQIQRPFKSIFNHVKHNIYSSTMSRNSLSFAVVVILIIVVIRAPSLLAGTLVLATTPVLLAASVLVFVLVMASHRAKWRAPSLKGPWLAGSGGRARHCVPPRSKHATRHGRFGAKDTRKPVTSFSDARKSA